MVALCEICHAKPAVGKCKICGRSACETHLVNGVCSICRANLCMICGRRLAIGYCSICGRLGCSECLVQIDNVRKVCVECLKRYRDMKVVGELLARRVLRVPQY